MTNSILKKTIPALLLGAVSVGSSYGMEVVLTGANRAMHSIGPKLNQVIHAQKSINNVHCPMGVYDTLGLLGAISEERIQHEIAEFTGDDQIITHLTSLNRLLLANSQPHVSAYKWDKRKFDFTNGVYALMAEQLNLNTGHEEKLQALGSQIIGVNFSKAQQTADTINGIVARDTHGKITEILPADSFDQDSVFVLLHTLYVNASWCFDEAEESLMQFKSLEGEKKFVKSLGLKAHNLKFTQQEGVIFVSLPTVGDCQLTIRHSKNSTDLKPITESEIRDLMGRQEEYIRSFDAPYISMKADLNLKSLLGDQLPQILQGSFQTELTSASIRIADYIQKVTFDMTNKGIEASAATAMHGVKESCRMKREKDGPIIQIDSPFTFALTKTMNGTDYLLFQGQVVNHEVME